MNLSKVKHWWEKDGDGSETAGRGLGVKVLMVPVFFLGSSLNEEIATGVYKYIHIQYN